MGKHESVEGIKDQVTLAPSDAPLMTLDDGGRAADPTKIALAAIEALKIEAPTGEAPRIELSGLAAPKIDAPLHDEINLATEQTEPNVTADEPIAAAQAHEGLSSRISPFAMMAASLAGAAGFGAMLGALVASGIARPVPVASANPAVKFGIEEVNSLKEQVVQARVELAALKVNIDAGHRSANQQFTKISERVERMERTQAEPIARLTKAVESLDRLERRADANARDITGSLTPPQPIAGKPPGVEGWVLRDVRRGTAFIEGRMGVIEVDQGDIVPGVGRVEAIRKQDGRWVVVTSKGVITSPR